VASAAALLNRARTAHARGREAMGSGRPDLAARVLARGLDAARKAGEGAEARELQARLLITMANAEFELRGHAAAVQRLEAAEQVVADDPARIRLALHGQRGLFLVRAGRIADALEELERAELFFAEGTHLERCVVLLNRGAAYLDFGAYLKARDDFRRCADEAAAGGLSVLQVKATHNQGFVEYLLGNLPGALALMAAAFAADPAVSPGIALQGRARVLAEAGLIREADDTFAQAAEIFRRARLAQDLAATELDRARCALIAGEIDAARRLAARARDRWRRRGDERWQRAAELVLLQGDLAAGRPATRLIEPALRAQGSFEESGLRLQARTAARIVAETRLRAGDTDAARVALDAVRPGRDDPVSARLHHRLVEARLALAQRRPAVAARRISTGLDELARYQARFGSIDLSTAAALHGRHLAELGIATALDSGKPQRMFAAAEQARAVTNRLPPVRPPEDPHAAELLTELRQTIESLRAVEQDPARSAPLLTRRRELEQQISARAWTRTGAGEAAQVASVEEVLARSAADGATLVMLVQSGASMHAVVAAESRLTARETGPAAPLVELVRRVRADLDVLAQPRLPDALRAAVHASYDRSLHRLDEALGLPATEHMVIVSTGVFGQLPWGLLPSLRGVAVTVAPSATAWLRSRTRPGREALEVACVAGPGLLRGEDEASAVAASWPGAGLASRERATGEATAKIMSTANLVHVAAHGTHQTENPLFSSLRLADGPLFAYELDQSGRAPEHVVLSACELGLATVRPGDEALGLTSVLLRLGSRCVVAGVARVGDEIAAQTMAAYHAELAAGADSASALATALRRNASDRPAPFVCFGSAWAPGSAFPVAAGPGWRRFGSETRRHVPWTRST
jgi:CHAT domain-containing protein/tetratricopeptide (TPR) repeat protein